MKGKVLLITGKKGEKRLKKILSETEVPGEIYVAKVDVAAFLTPKIILKELSQKNLREVEKVIIPGTVVGNTAIISRELGIPVIKGPNSLEELKRFLGERKEKERVISPGKKSLLKIGKRNSVFLSERICKVVAEIIDAPKLSSKELGEIAKYYLNSGAEIIDLGMIAGEDNSEKIPEIIKAIRKKNKAPVSIDTLNEKEILTAVDQGIDLILSLDFSNYKIAKKIDVPAVIIPQVKGEIPLGVRERIALIEKLVKKLKEENFNQVIVDPILSPVNFGFLKSLRAYSQFREKHPKIPLLMGVGNITELMDVDSIGLNGLLAGIASELGVNLLLTTEASPKTKGSIKELSLATKMMELAKLEQSQPKDLGEGLNLLRLKRKKINLEKMLPEEKEVKIIKTKERKIKLEKGIWFRIYLAGGKIKVIYYKDKNPQLQFVGSSGKALYQEIIARKLTKNLEHSAYLGKELKKAELALKLGRNYLQDGELFDF